MSKILVVEDNIVLSKTIKALLVHERHLVEVTHRGLDAIEKTQQEYYDLIVLDWDLPDTQGIEVCKHYRNTGGTKPVLFLTGKRKAEDKVLGLDSGADDYLVKPFDHMEFLARVRALLRRKTVTESTNLKMANLEIDIISNTIYVDNVEQEFYPVEVALLRLFLENPDFKFSTQILLERLWSSASETSTDSIKTYIAKLRKRLAKYGANIEIRNTMKVGYYLVDIEKG